MKIPFLLSVQFCFAVFVQCYGRNGYHPLEKLIEAQQFKRPDNYVTEDLRDEYSPVYVGPQEGLKDADKISNLPGQPTGANFGQYSGYVTVDPDAGRALFYYFAESPENSSSNPLVLWLSGGPGCSSIGDGAMMELGPFRVNDDGQSLSQNKYSWNNVANVLFLESPAGVGFSYSNSSSDYITGDIQTAKDSYTFLVNWLERFPEYKARDFFVTGGSYSGHYVPQLVQLVLQNNKSTNQTIINLKGLAIANAYIDYEAQLTGTYDFFWSHALISDEIHEGILLNCNFSSDANQTEACDIYRQQANDARGNISDYDIYAPLCSASSNYSPSISGFDPCSYQYIQTYLNIPEVQKAFHANVTGLPGPWQGCNEYIGTNWKDQPLTVLPLIQDLMASGISVWIYSGDTDGIVPVTSTRYSIDKLKTSVKTPWHPWYFQEQVGGYAVGYENLTFVTVRGAGHFVPSYQPGRALAVFSSFLDGKLPPSHL